MIYLLDIIVFWEDGCVLVEFVWWVVCEVLFVVGGDWIFVVEEVLFEEVLMEVEWNGFVVVWMMVFGIMIECDWVSMCGSVCY